MNRRYIMYNRDFERVCVVVREFVSTLNIQETHSLIQTFIEFAGLFSNLLYTLLCLSF